MRNNYQQIFTKLSMSSSMQNLFVWKNRGCVRMSSNNLLGKDPGCKVTVPNERASPTLYLNVVAELRQWITRFRATRIQIAWQFVWQSEGTVFTWYIVVVLRLTFWHRSFTFNSNKSPTWCNSFSVYYSDVCLQLNMFRAFSRPSSGAQW
jgi:hypothetical protein